MAYQYLSTARLNATPLARHIDTPEPRALPYRTAEEALAAMKADADVVKLRMCNAKMKDTTRDEVFDNMILAYVTGNPGKTAVEIAEAIHRKASNTRQRLKAMALRGAVKVSHTSHPSTYHIGTSPKPREKARRASLVRDKVVAFLRANPGCRTPDLAEHMGCSTKTAAAHVSEVRKVHNIRSERAPGASNNTPARHWIED
jgi:predicted transcriptional regulator